MQLAVGERLDGAHVVSVDLDGEHQAGAHGLAVELHGARPADAVLAAHVGSGEAQVVAQEVRQQRPRLDVALHRRAVDPRGDPHASASLSARRTSSAISARRWSPSTPSAARAPTSAGAAPAAATCSAPAVRIGVGPAPSSAIAQRSPGTMTTAAPAVAKSP